MGTWLCTRKNLRDMESDRLRDYGESAAGRRFSEFIFILPVMSKPQEAKAMSYCESLGRGKLG